VIYGSFLTVILGRNVERAALFANSKEVIVLGSALRADSSVATSV
jgi:hypothetical protein